METNSIFIKDNATSKKKLWNLQQRATGNSRGSSQVKTVLTKYSRHIWNLDGPQKPEIFLGTSQAEWETNKIVFEATRLWLYTMTYSRKNEHQSRYSFKKRSS